MKYYVLFSSDCNKFPIVKIGSHSQFDDAFSILQRFTRMTKENLLSHLVSSSLNPEITNIEEDDEDEDDDDDEYDDYIQCGLCEEDACLFQIKEWGKKEYENLGLGVHSNCVYKPSFWIVHTNSTNIQSMIYLM